MEVTFIFTLGSQIQHTYALENHTRSIQQIARLNSKRHSYAKIIYVRSIQQQHPTLLRTVSPNTQHTRQTDPLTEQHRK